MNEKTKGLIINIILYAIAFTIGLFVSLGFDDIFMSTFIFTIVATLVIFLVTCFIPDTSLYDPYWSVAPLVMIIMNMIRFNLWNVNAIIMLSIISFWSLRLTINWFITYKGLLHEDWRYRYYRENLNKFGFFCVNLIGLQYVPTIVVYFGLIDALYVMQNPVFNPLILIGVFIMVTAIILEIVSDSTIHKFIKENKGKHITCNVGVWKYSRHPNYLGEVSFWFGIGMCFFLTQKEIWYHGFGYLLIFFLFMFVSIPLMEKHNKERRVDYLEYMSKTSRFLLLPNKKESN